MSSLRHFPPADGRDLDGSRNKARREMIVDTHVHATEPPPGDDGSAHAILAEDLLAHAEAAGVDKIVDVVPSRMGTDNRYAFEILEKYADRIVGVVAVFDTFGPDIEARLRALKEHPKMLGIRLSLFSPENDKLLVEGKFEPFFAAAEKVDTAIQIFAPYRVPELHAAARRYPRARWLIDHMGLRYLDGKDNSQPFRQWPELLKAAEEPNIWIKCSYFPEACKDIESYPYPTAQKYFRQLYDNVDPKRLIWGSNYPPVLSACSYKQAVDFMRVECDFVSPADREAIMGGNFLKYFGR